jgi:hypothetical protein
MAPRAPLQIVVVLGQVDPEPKDPMLRHHANKASALGLAINEVSERCNERLLTKVNTIND